MSDKTSRQFVDTNVLIYAYDSTAGWKQQRASELLASLWDTGGGCVSIQVLQEFYVVATRKVPARLDPVFAAQVIRDLGQWTVFTPGAPDVVAAIEAHQRNRISFWDAMIVQSAMELGCDLLWSEDLNAGQTISRVRVVNPFTSTP